MSTHRLFMYGGLAALFIAVVIPHFFFGSKTSPRINQDVDKGNRFPGGPPPPNFAAKSKETRSTKHGWATTLAPIYTIIVFLYVAYIMYKITTRKQRSPEIAHGTQGHRSVIFGKHGNKKTKITEYELNQLEQKLVKSEEAVQKILMKANKVISDTFEKMDLENNTSSSSDSERSRIFEVPTDESSSSSSPRGDSSEDQTSDINKLQRQPKFPMHGVSAQDEEREALLNERRLLIERLEHDSSTSEDLSQSEILDEMSSQHNRRKTEQRSDEDSSDLDQDIGNVGPRFHKDSFDDILEKVGLNENNSSQENRCVEKFEVINRKKQRVSRSALEEEDSSEEILSEDSSSFGNSSSWTSSSEEMETLGQNNLEHDDVKTELEL